VPKLRHPRSDWLLSQLPQPERHFRIMAKVNTHTPIVGSDFMSACDTKEHHWQNIPSVYC
jgi:hypothetical protein